MASDYPRCEFPEFRTKEIQPLLNHTQFKTIATKETIKRYQFINDVLKRFKHMLLLQKIFVVSLIVF
jgi:hypothetical protein